MNKSHKTAIVRTVASRPCIWLAKQDRLIGRCLDYGCGRGKDADRFKLESYDPHYGPKLPLGKFDTIICTYVLNCVDTFDRARIVSKIKKLLKPGGLAYFTVRRDIRKTPGAQKKSCGTIQYWVELREPYFTPIRYLPSQYEIYEIESN